MGRVGGAVTPVSVRVPVGLGIVAIQGRALTRVVVVTSGRARQGRRGTVIRAVAQRGGTVEVHLETRELQSVRRDRKWLNFIVYLAAVVVHRRGVSPVGRGLDLARIHVVSLGQVAVGLLAHPRRRAADGGGRPRGGRRLVVGFWLRRRHRLVRGRLRRGHGLVVRVTVPRVRSVRGSAVLGPGRGLGAGQRRLGRRIALGG